MRSCTMNSQNAISQVGGNAMSHFSMSNPKLDNGSMLFLLRLERPGRALQPLLLFKPKWNIQKMFTALFAFEATGRLHILLFSKSICVCLKHCPPFRNEATWHPLSIILRRIKTIPMPICPTNVHKQKKKKNKQTKITPLKKKRFYP